MALFRIPSKCKKCGRTAEMLWPLGEGVCDKCLVKGCSLEEALKATCGCFHNHLRELYKNSRKGR